MNNYVPKEEVRELVATASKIKIDEKAKKMVGKYIRNKKLRELDDLYKLLTEMVVNLLI